MRVVIVSERQADLTDFAQGLNADVEWVRTMQSVLKRAKKSPWHLVILDALTPGLEYKKALFELMSENAMLNTAVITDMDDEAFHEDSEGLGVLCAIPAVPAVPGRTDGTEAMRQLVQILGLG